MSDLAWGESVRDLQEGFSITFHFWSTETPIYDELEARYGTWTHHRLQYDSFLRVADGQLDHRCFGCGRFDSEWPYAHGMSEYGGCV